MNTCNLIRKALLTYPIWVLVTSQSISLRLPSWSSPILMKQRPYQKRPRGPSPLPPTPFFAIFFQIRGFTPFTYGIVMSLMSLRDKSHTQPWCWNAIHFFLSWLFPGTFPVSIFDPNQGGWLANAKITRRPFIPRNCTTISWQGRRRQGWQNTDGGGIVWHQLSTQHSWFGEQSLHVLNTPHAHCSALSKRGYLYHLWYENLEKEVWM